MNGFDTPAAKAALERAQATPMFFIVGAPRCGTTAMAAAVRDHPQVCFSVPKEPHYFSRLPQGWSPEKLFVDYFPIFFRHREPHHTVLAEGSPSYLYGDEILGTIDRCFPTAKFIIMVRNPMEMLASYHQRLVYLLDEDVTDITTAWKLQEERAQGRSVPRRCRNAYLLQYAGILQVGVRAEALIAMVGRERVKLVLFDDLQRDSLAVYRDVLNFLGLPDDGRTRIAKRNRTRVPTNVMIHLLLVQPRSEVMRVLLARLKRASRRMPLLQAILRRVRRGSATVASRPSVPPALWPEVAAAVREDVARLSRLFGRDLSHWLEPPRAGAADPPARGEPAAVGAGLQATGDPAR